MAPLNDKDFMMLTDAGEIYSVGERIARCRYALQARQESAVLYDMFGDREESPVLAEISGILSLGSAEEDSRALQMMRPGATVTLQLCDGRGLPVVVQGIDQENQVRVSSPDFVA